MLVKLCGECRERVEVVVVNRGPPRLAEHGGDGKTFHCLGSNRAVTGLRPVELEQARKT
jgi:hypothetical protein